MSQSSRPIHVGRDVPFHASDGEPIEAITVWLWNTSPLSARLLLTPSVWDRVRTSGLFGADGLSLSAGRSSTDALLVDLEVVNPSHPTDKRVLKREFANPDSRLRSTDEWAARRVRNHESTGISTAESSPAAVGTGSSEAPDDDPSRVSSFDISLHHSQPAGTSESSTSVGDSTPDPSDWEALTEPLSNVAAALSAENRPFEPGDDGRSLLLAASVDYATWQVVIEDAADDDQCLIRSLFPDRLSESRRRSLQSALEAYTATLNRGGFVVESTGHVEFRTPFDPQTESPTDALTENVTALAEWFDRLTP